MQTAIDAFGSVDIVINNAGILRDKSFHNMDAATCSTRCSTSTCGARSTSPSRRGPSMREQSYGRIVSTSSAAGIFGNFGQANYGAAKMGLVGLTNVLAIEGAKYNIKANAIAPLALTRMTEDIMGALGDKLDAALISPLVTYLTHESCDRPAASSPSVAAGSPRCSSPRPTGIRIRRASPRRTCATTGRRSPIRPVTRCRRRSPTRPACSSPP